MLDQGKPQRIDVFRAGQQAGHQDDKARRLRSRLERFPTAVSSFGESLPERHRAALRSAQYAPRLQSVRAQGNPETHPDPQSAQDRVAIYALGRDLHVLQEFTDDPGETASGSSRHLDSGRDLMPANVADALFDLPVDMTGQIDAGGRAQGAFELGMQRASIESEAGLTAQVYAANNDSTTLEALRRIVEHLGERCRAAAI